MSRRQRRPARDESQAIVFWLDLDKTYLATRFESLRELLRIPFEDAADKVHVPGIPELIQALRGVAVYSGLQPRLRFLSGSPPQLEKVVREKLLADGVVVDSMVFKDQLDNLVRGHWGSLREQVGYKLSELLEARLCEDPISREILFGDDWESDPIIYSLYADVLNGTLEVEDLRHYLEYLQVRPRYEQRILAATEELRRKSPPAEIVERIFIRRAKRRPLDEFQVFGSRLVPSSNYGEVAAVLFSAGRLDAKGLLEVLRAIRRSDEAPGLDWGQHLQDLPQRGLLPGAPRRRLRRLLTKEGFLERASFPEECRQWWRDLRLSKTSVPEEGHASVAYGRFFAERRA